MAQTLKLFTSDGRALTNLVSEDDSILLPTEIEVTEDSAVAHHADSGDVTYDSLESLCFDYGLAVDEVIAEMAAQ